MENKKYEQLIDLIINEQEDKARELFHEIVVEKSREIYESIMDEEMMDEGGQMTGEVADLLDEIDVEETGMTEEEDAADIAFDDEAEEAGDDLTHDMEAGHDEKSEKLDSLKDEFEDLFAELEAMFKSQEDGADMGGEEDEVVDSEEEVTEAKDEEEEEEGEEMMEAVQLKKVPVPSGGDDGANKKSIALTKPRVETAGVKPVNFSQGGDEAVPTSPKKPSNAYSKGEKDVDGASNFKNVPGKDNFKEKGEAAPKPVTKDGSAGGKSPVAKG